MGNCMGKYSVCLFIWSMLLPTWAGVCLAGEFNRVLSVGDVAPVWRNLEGVDGQQHSLEDLDESRFVVVAFTCNSCPYAQDVEGRLITLADQVKDLGGALVAINVNTITADALPAMKEKSRQKKFTFPYLYDPTQAIAKAFGATTTPEFFLLDESRKIAYMGALDDSPDGQDVRQKYLETAIGDLVARRQPVLSETVPIGCRIRIQRIRSSKAVEDRSR